MKSIKSHSDYFETTYESAPSYLDFDSNDFEVYEVEEIDSKTFNTFNTFNTKPKEKKVEKVENYKPPVIPISKMTWGTLKKAPQVNVDTEFPALSASSEKIKIEKKEPEIIAPIKTPNAEKALSGNGFSLLQTDEENVEIIIKNTPKQDIPLCRLGNDCENKSCKREHKPLSESPKPPPTAFEPKKIDPKLLEKTVMCKFGTNCYKPVCNFAHSPDELRRPPKPPCMFGSNCRNIRCIYSHPKKVEQAPIEPKQVLDLPKRIPDSPKQVLDLPKKISELPKQVQIPLQPTPITKSENQIVEKNITEVKDVLPEEKQTTEITLVGNEESVKFAMEIALKKGYTKFIIEIKH